eukprot:SAG31_NODE_38163_length_298_cov_1.030151_1_plen_99_part_11
MGIFNQRASSGGKSMEFTAVSNHTTIALVVAPGSVAYFRRVNFEAVGTFETRSSFEAIQGNLRADTGPPTGYAPASASEAVAEASYYMSSSCGQVPFID